MSQSTDIDLQSTDIVDLGSLDAIVSFFNRLGYDTDNRAPLTPESIGRAGGLFSDYFLRERLREDANWQDNPSKMFTAIRNLMKDAAQRWCDNPEDVVRKEQFDPIFKKLGFNPEVNKPAESDQTIPHYLLKGSDGKVITAAFIYQWERWLDGPDQNDPDTPNENPGACVVSALDEGIADWIIVTNGRHWRIYGKQAHARSTNFYEVDLAKALLATGDTDPHEAFRYWWLFFRSEAYQIDDGVCWLDDVLQGSREYAKRLGDRLKDRIFTSIFPRLAQAFLSDRKKRLEIKSKPTEDELSEIFEATLIFLYRLLFLLYSESRHLVPINEAPYQVASLKRIKEELAETIGVAESEVAAAVKKSFSATETTIYDRLGELFRAMDKGDTVLNVPTYKGGLFNTAPETSEYREHRISQFLIQHKIPDRQLALAIDRLSRDQDERTLGLVFIDYKSLEVRHLGSIYEGLLEFKLKVATEDLTTKTVKGKEKFISLSEVSPRSRSRAEVVVKKNAVYLSNDKAERKASGSYYTPDPIVEYIVANTVGPAIDEKLEALRSDFRKVRKTFDNEIEKAKVAPLPEQIKKGEMDERQWANLKMFQAHKDLVEKMFDLHVCDPAMGSGHFLAKVVDFVTDRMLKFLNQFPVNPINYSLEKTRSSIIESLAEQGITVDPTNLTDINLLKRHVLKRCVYGVDLNPMAVELAKVSLWLDCFTLGAPLNFLDHHLRCGNSLIGATFKDLEDATTGQLFSIDYEPLMRAINQLIQVSKLADATSAEVASSVSQYDTACQALTGYQVILDLLVAKHFGFPDAPRIVEHGQSLDLSNRDNFVSSLEDDDDRELVADIEALARQADRRFFHWEVEFPEIFFAFVDADQRQIKHKDHIESGTAGFDCIVGNPPYSGHKSDENLKILKAFFNVCSRYQNFATAFMEKATHVSNRNAHIGFIIPKSIQYVSAWSPARKLIAVDRRLKFLIDVSKAFKDVLLEQTICGWSKEDSTEQYVSGTLKNSTDFECSQLSTRFLNDMDCLPAEIDKRSVDLYDKLDVLGPRLAQLSHTSQALGYQAKVNKSLSSKVHPIYRGKLVQPMELCDTEDFIDDSFLLGTNEDRYTDKIERMLQPKVVSQNIVAHVTKPKPRVWIISAPDPKGVLCLNTISTTILNSNRFSIYYISAILNSSLASWFMYEFIFCRAVRTMHLDHHYVGQIPVADCSQQKQEKCFEVFRQIDAGNIPKKERIPIIDDVIFEIYQLTDFEKEFVNSYCYGKSRIAYATNET